MFVFDVAFEVPVDFKPWYMEFKRGARADLTNQTMEEEPPNDASIALGDKGPAGRVDRDAKVGRAPGGLTHLANAIEERTGVSVELPVPLPYTDPKVRQHVSGGRFRGGRFYVSLPEEKFQAEVREFVVPDGKKLFQVGADVLKAESMFGRAVNRAYNALAQIRVQDANGKNYFAIGQYGAAAIKGQPYFEIQYYPEAEVPERCLKEPDKVTRKVIHDAGPDKSKYGFLFLVDPGVKIVSFNIGNKKQSLNIQVPN